MKKTVVDYLSKLRWDGTSRIDRWLVDYAGADHDARTRAAGRGMLVGAVRRARQPGCRLDELPVLVGPQGCGKSTALRILAIEDDWYAQVDLDGTLLDLALATRDKWIVEWSELRIDSHDPNALKLFVTETSFKVRLPYAREVSALPKAFAIVGTTSMLCGFEADVDPGTLRRVWPVAVRHFDCDRLREHRHQLWAEACVFEAAGTPVFGGS